MFVAICMVMFVPVMAVTSKAAVESYGVWIGNEQFTKYNLTIDGNKGNAVYDPDTHTITFHDFNGVTSLYEDESVSYQVYSKNNDITITIKGNATFTDTENETYGMFFKGDCVVDENADITINVTRNAFTSWKNLTINGKVDITNNTVTDYSIDAYKTLTIGDNAQVKATATKNYSNAIIGEKIIISGKVTATANGGNSVAIYSNGGDLTFKDGCNVTANSVGNSGIAIKSDNSIYINNCDLVANGADSAIKASSINLDSEAYINSPEKAKVSEDGKKIVDKDGNECKEVVFKHVKYYDLYLGNVHVSEVNKDNIPGVKGGFASYNPATKTLTFTGTVTGVEKPYRDGAHKMFVVSDDDLTINGNVEINNDDEYDYVVEDKGDSTLKLNGNITAKSQWCAIWNDGNVIINGTVNVASNDYNAVECNNLTVNGCLTAESESDDSIKCNGKLTVGLKGSVVASIEGFGGRAIKADEICVKGGSITATANGGDAPFAIYVNNNMVVEDGIVNATSISDSGPRAICTNSGDLWVKKGTLTATAKGENSEAINIYNSSCNLIVDDGTITATSSGDGSRALNGNAIINGGKVTLSSSGYESCAMFGDSFMLSGGNVEVTTSENSYDLGYAIHAGKIAADSGTLTVNSSCNGTYNDDAFHVTGGVVNIIANGKWGICSHKDYNMSAGVVNTKGNKYGFLVDCDKMTITGGKLTAEGKTYAILMEEEDRSIFGLGVVIVEPQGGEFIDNDGGDYYVTSSAGDAKKVVIEGIDKYPLWIGDTQVTSLNKDNIDGVVGGTAKYDPDKKILTFDNVTDVTGKHEDSLIYSNNNLTIKGNVTLNNSDNCGIKIENNSNLTIDGNVSVKTINDNAVYVDNGSLTITKSGELTATSTNITAVFAEKNINVSGELIANGKEYAVCTNHSLNVNKTGKIDAISNSDVSMYGESSITIAGTVFSKSVKEAIESKGTINITGTVEAESTSSSKGTIYSNADIILDGVSVKVKSASDYAIYSKAGNINIKSGMVEVQANKIAIYSELGTILSENMKISDNTPLIDGEKVSFGGSVSNGATLGTKSFIKADGINHANIVKLEPKAIFTVSFNGLGHGSKINVEKVTIGKAVDEPDEPTEKCCIFKGWYTDKACTIEYDFDAPVTEDITLYAKWEVRHTLTHVEKKDATYTGEGNNEYYSCNDCGKFFSDADANNEIEEGSWIIPKLQKKPEPVTGGNVQNSDIPVGGTVEDNNNKYKVTSDMEGDLEVAFVSTQAGNASNVVVPEEITINGKTYKVTTIEENAFINNKTIKTVTIEKNVTTIGENAFSGCTKLSAVKMKDGITEIKAGAFANCTSLKKLVIPKTVKKIGKNAYKGCKNLKDIKIKTTKLTKKSVGKNAFKGIHKKAKVKVPKKKLKSYKKILKGVGINGKKQKITK
jgi:uncharacterized repeat protein (TIGR02543 family)